MGAICSIETPQQLEQKKKRKAKQLAKEEAERAKKAEQLDRVSIVVPGRLWRTKRVEYSPFTLMKPKVGNANKLQNQFDRAIAC